MSFPFSSLAIYTVRIMITSFESCGFFRALQTTKSEGTNGRWASALRTFKLLLRRLQFASSLDFLESHIMWRTMAISQCHSSTSCNTVEANFRKLGFKVMFCLFFPIFQIFCVVDQKCNSSIKFSCKNPLGRKCCFWAQFLREAESNEWTSQWKWIRRPYTNWHASVLSIKCT